MSEQMSLLEWNRPADVLAFPFHRSHGATIAVSRSIVHMETAKRSGKLNSLRAQTRKRLEPLLGFDEADKAADDLIRAIKVGFAYFENSPPHKQIQASAVILSLTDRNTETPQHSNSDGEANACDPSPQGLVRYGRIAHERTEYDAARARDGGAA